MCRRSIRRWCRRSTRGHPDGRGFGPRRSTTPSMRPRPGAGPGEDEMTDRVREAMLADSLTSRYAEVLEIETDGGTVWLRGTVDDVGRLRRAAPRWRRGSRASSR